MSEFDYNIQHKPGIENIIPDMLSRLPIPNSNKIHIRAINTDLLWQRYANATSTDSILKQIKQFVSTNSWPDRKKIQNDMASYYPNCLDFSIYADAF